MSQNHQESNNGNKNNVTGEADQTGNMYCYNENSNSMNEPPKESNAMRRSLGEETNPYRVNQPNYLDNNRNQIPEQNAIRRSIGDKNPNSDFPNYAEKSSEQRIPHLQQSRSPFEVNQYEMQSHHFRPEPRKEKKNYLLTFLFIGILEILLIVLIAISNYFDYGEGGKDKADEYLKKEFSYYYHFFKDVHLMIFIGFGLLYTALKDHQWSSIGITLFIGIISFQVSFIYNCLWKNSFTKSGESWEKISLDFEELTRIDYIAAPVLISLGSLIGKLSLSQFLLIAIFEPFFSSLNYFLNLYSIKAIDNGGSLYIHAFGAIFGLTVTSVIFCNSKENSKIVNSPHLSSDYYSNIISFIGGLFLWLYFPSFNVSNIQCSKAEKEKQEFMEIFRYRGIVNTYLSMIGSVIGTFVVSPIVSHGKIKMEHLINGSYVGGIIIGGCCTICSSAWGAILIGFIGGCISVLGLWKLKKILKEHKLDDTFVIMHTFGIPGILGGFLTSIFFGNFTNDSWKWIKDELKSGDDKNQNEKNVIKNLFGNDKSFSEQAGIQIAAIFVTIAFAGGAGIMLGFILKALKSDKNQIYFVDSELYCENELIPFPEWKYPRMSDENLSSSGNKIDLQEREVNIQQV